MTRVLYFPLHVRHCRRSFVWHTGGRYKLLGARNAEIEGHSVGTVTDALGRGVLALRFRRRGKSQMDPLRKMFSTLLGRKRQEALNS